MLKSTTRFIFFFYEPSSKSNIGAFFLLYIIVYLDLKKTFIIEELIMKKYRSVGKPIPTVFGAYDNVST